MKTARSKSQPFRNIGRILLGLLLVSTGIAHLTFARAEFLAQVPDWVPLDGDWVVLLSGIVELLLGLGLLLLSGQRRRMGWIAALFFVAIFPGNLQQYLDGNPAFGLETETLRFTRLFFQPLLVLWALWSTGIWPKPTFR